MIFGVGCDIAKVSRFKKWVENDYIIERFFNSNEIILDKNVPEQKLCEHYAARFAAKEAFSKALGTGLRGFNLTDVYIQKKENGMPELIVTGKAQTMLCKICGKNSFAHVSLSHEKEYSIAFVVIECDNK